jgi:hypothetical protein
MGLLDEAIRDHLELQRLQGADPGEIARKEREALEPVLPDEPATWGAHPPPVLDGAIAQDEIAASDHTESESLTETAAPESVVDFSTVGQETVEIDMRAVLEEAEDGLAEGYPPGHAATAPVRAARITDHTRITDPLVHKNLEWEVAGHAANESGHTIPGQERLSF